MAKPPSRPQQLARPGGDGPFRARFTDAEDLSVVASYLQDALVPVSEMSFEGRRPAFRVGGPTFRERPTLSSTEEAFGERVHTGLRFDNVTGVRLKGINRSNPGEILSLLTLAVDESTIDLVFADDKTIRLDVERIDGVAEDLGSLGRLSPGCPMPMPTAAPTATGPPDALNLKTPPTGDLSVSPAVNRADQPLVLVVPKGRILDEIQPIMDRAGVRPEAAAFFDKNARQLRASTDDPDLEIIRVRSFDTATLSAFGAADIAIAGSDVLMEFDHPEIYAPLDLDVGHCRLP